MTERRKKWLKRGGILLGTLVVLECLLRLVAGNMTFAPFMFYLEDGRCVGLEPNGSVTYTGWLWRIEPVEHGANEYGYRGPAHAPEKPDGVFRIAALGDSFVYGQGVRAEDTVSAQLERKLSDRLPGVQVLNFGVPGYSMEDYLDQYALFIKRWSPDLLLLFLFGNDMGASLCAEKPKPTQEGVPLARSQSTTHLYLLRALHMVVRFGLVFTSRVQDGHDPGDQTVRFDAQLGELKRTADREGTRLAVVVLDDPLTAEGALTDTLWLHGVPKLADDEGQWDLDRIPGETHYSAKGLNDLADYVERWLIDKQLIPLDGAVPASVSEPVP